MSVSRVNLFSTSLLRTVDITVILPIEKNVMNPNKEYKTLYLLHGMLGSDIDWLYNTRIKLWAEEYDLAVVMPSGENACYVDNPAALEMFSTFVGEELVNITRNMFPLSTKREDTFIAGLSMGGFGSLLNGFKYNETFSHVGSFSTALIGDIPIEENTPFMNSGYFEKVFSCTQAESRNTDKDPRYVIENLEGSVPKLYLTCGSEDFVLASSKTIHSFLHEHGIDHDFVVEPGNHEWNYWDKKIFDFLEWLPIEKTSDPMMGSGNVPVND